MARLNQPPPYLIACFAAMVLAWAGDVAAESTRLKLPPPGPEEAQDIAVQMAKNDGLLRQGDIVVTPRGFLVFEGVASDGFTHEFAPVPNPLNQNGARKNNELRLRNGHWLAHLNVTGTLSKKADDAAPN